MITALVSLSGSPGVSCLSLAMATMSAVDALLVEADAAGGAVAFGYLRGESVADGGLYPAVTSVRRGSGGSLTEALSRNVYALEHPAGLAQGSRLLWLPGFNDPGQALALTPNEWDGLSQSLAGLAQQGLEVIVDAGRLYPGSPVRPVLQAADRVLVVCHPTRSAARVLHSWRPMLTAELGRGRTGVVLNGAGTIGQRDAEAALELPVVAVVGHDPDVAHHLSGAGPSPRRTDRSPMLGAAKSLLAAKDLVGAS